MENIDLALEDATELLDSTLNDNDSGSLTRHSTSMGVNGESIVGASSLTPEGPTVEVVGREEDDLGVGPEDLPDDASLVEASRPPEWPSAVYVPPPLVVQPFLRSNYHLSSIDLTVSDSCLIN